MQEACAKCLAVHILRFEILQTTWKNKKHQNTKSKNWKLRVWCSLFHFYMWFNVIWKVSNFDMWIAKHLVKAFWTDVTLHWKVAIWNSRTLVCFFSQDIIWVLLDKILWYFSANINCYIFWKSLNSAAKMFQTKVA